MTAARGVLAYGKAAGVKARAVTAVVTALASIASASGLLGCAVTSRDRVPTEQFASKTTHSRDYAAPVDATCEASRRALLSQGYVVSLADAEHVNAKKNFQPEPATHVEVEVHVVCAAADRHGTKSIAFVNALQDQYALKKSNNSASLGVGVLGSVSLPFSSSDDSMVKVASETVATDSFYEGFFDLLDRYLAADTTEGLPLRPPASAGGAASAPAGAASAPLAPPGAAASAAAATGGAASPAVAASAIAP